MTEATVTDADLVLGYLNPDYFLGGSMKLHDRSEIDRPSAVWPYVVNAGHFLQWNDKIVDTEARGEFRLGQTFHTQYRMSGREMRCWSRVTALEPRRLLELRHGN